MTTLVKWTPFRELDLMERRMRRMLEDVGFGPITMPAADIYETPTEFVVELEVPGFEEQELKLEVTDHTLTVTGEAQAETKKEDEKTFILHERLARAFERRFQLPVDADTEKLAAKFDGGVLEIHARESQGRSRGRSRSSTWRNFALTSSDRRGLRAPPDVSAAEGAQGVEDDRYVDPLLEQRAEHRLDEAESREAHGDSAQAHPDEDALAGDVERPAADADGVPHAVDRSSTMTASAVSDAASRPRRPWRYLHRRARAPARR